MLDDPLAAANVAPGTYALVGSTARGGGWEGRLYPPHVFLLSDPPVVVIASH